MMLHDERCRIVRDGEMKPEGEYVLYWVHHAMRGHENPALEVAQEAARSNDRPLLVYQELSEEYPYASDRHFLFLMQGARELAAELAVNGISYAFSLGAKLHEMAARATLVVTDEMPIRPFTAWADSIQSVPAWSVDTSCVVPMNLVGKAYERAFEYRNETRNLYQQHLREAWADTAPAVPAFPLDQVGFEPVDLQTANLPGLLSQCNIDHAIGPVEQTTGGSIPGYARWEQFRRNGLRTYDRQRNDPLLDGTSRLSPYLNYGMVSPFRIAREAAEIGGSGAEKFLDEMLIWRELAYVFCFYRPDHETLKALPPWARETLHKHASDPRPAIYTRETLARAQTGDAFWNAAQRSLLLNGELHNNVRMTWGKAFLNWTPDPETALRTMIDLNHRYALDGCNPSSYGGLLWCLGQFDRPFSPERSIFGTVRERSTAQHAARLDPVSYSSHITGSATKPSIAVIGAGISGLFCARTLSDYGFDVRVFDKGRVPGGRMSTRIAAEGLQFDHGAQYFTARDPHFQRYVRSWCDQGLAAEWRGRIVSVSHGQVDDRSTSAKPHRRFVGAPGMNAICRHLGNGLPVHFGVRVAPPRRTSGGWRLCGTDDGDLGVFDVLVVAVPAPQASPLLADAPELAKAADRVRMSGCWALMLGFDAPIDVPYDGAFIGDDPLSWIARDSSKPGRPKVPDNWVGHASSEWSHRHLEEPKDQIEASLRQAFFEAIGISPRPDVYSATHRWRYALPPEPLSASCLFDDDLAVGACGDWCSGPRVEGAFLSGMAIAGRILNNV